MKRVLFANIPCWLTFTLLLITPLIGLSQEGDYYVSNFVIEPDRIDKTYYSIERSDDGLIYVSNRSGILKFDGHRWKRIPCPGAVYSMKKKNDLFLVGGKFGFGYIKESQESESEYISLSDSIGDVENIFRVHEENNLVYFLNETDLFIYNDSSFQLLERATTDSIKYINLIEYNEALYLVCEDGNVKHIDGSTVSMIDSPFPDGSIPIFITKNNKGLTLMGSFDNKLFINDSSEFRSINVKDDGYLLDNQITSGIWLSDSLVAIGTLKGGLAILNAPTWDIHQIVNSLTGLNDNEVLGLQTDLDQGLWVAQSDGLDRVAPFLPVSNFTHYPGLSGKIASIFPNDTTLFVSTSMGVFYLKEVGDYNEVIDLIQRKIKVDVAIELSRKELRQLEQTKKAIETKNRTKEKTDGLAKDTTTRKGLFSFLRRKKKNQKDTLGTEPLVAEETKEKSGLLGRIFGPSTQTTVVKKDSTFTEKKIFKELQSIRYIYQRVDGINTNCSIYQSYGGDLIVGGLAGVFQIMGDSTRQITNTAIRDLIISRSGLMILSTVNGQVLFYEKIGMTWEEVDQLDNLDDRVLDIFEDYESNIWLTGTDLVYKLNFEGNDINIDEFDLDNPFSDRTIAIEAGTKILFVNPNGIYSLKPDGSTIERDTLVENYLGEARKYFGSHKEYAWIYNGTNWYRLGVQPGEKSPEILMLSLLQDIKYVSYDEANDAFWVVTNKNEIFRVENINSNLTSNYDLVLSDYEDMGTFLSEEILEFQELEGNIDFEYFHPDYSGVLGIQYRYRLEGLEQEWTGWTSDNQIHFPYLPPGDYRITVQSKDIFNQINQSPTIRFKVVPPYWQQPWFYALEVLLFSILFIISVRLNRSSSNRSLLLNRLLAFLTLILMVEFVQAIAEAKFEIDNSPVVNFFIQVSVAAAILPLERILRKWLIGETNVKKTKELEKAEK